MVHFLTSNCKKKLYNLNDFIIYNSIITLQMNGPEIKHTLRKIDYPQCAQEALSKIGTNRLHKRKSILNNKFISFRTINMWKIEYKTHGFSFGFNGRICILRSR